MYIINICVILAILAIFYYIANYLQSSVTTIENYNDLNGFYCDKCDANININQCINCFNCVWTRGQCVNGDYAGPKTTDLNNVREPLWFSGDPLTFSHQCVNYLNK